MNNDSDTPTPSAFVYGPRNAEHFEAQQEATNRERRAYIDSLTPEEQAKFAAVDAAIATIEAAKIPFFYVVRARADQRWQRGHVVFR